MTPEPKEGHAMSTYEEDHDLAVWSCKIGYHPRADLPHGSDAPMRAAIRAAFRGLAGLDDLFCFSGWAGELTEGEKAVVEDRVPRYERTETGQRQMLADALYTAWTVIANVGHKLGGWDAQDPEWVDAAARWRDEHFHKLLDLGILTSPEEEPVRQSHEPGS